MIDALAFALTLGCVLAAAVLLVRLVRRRYTWTAALPLLVAIEVGLIVQLVLDVIGLAGGHRPAETGTHVAYLAFSVVPIPVAGLQSRGDDGVWAAALLVAALVVCAVLVVRMQTTWRSGH